jgi:hypothetical protein
MLVRRETDHLTLIAKAAQSLYRSNLCPDSIEFGLKNSVFSRLASSRQEQFHL